MSTVRCLLNVRNISIAGTFRIRLKSVYLFWIEKPLTLARSLTLSVLPVPVGPAGQPPRFRSRAPVSVSQHLLVRGVRTSLGVQPKYS